MPGLGFRVSEVNSLWTRVCVKLTDRVLQLQSVRFIVLTQIWSVCRWLACMLTVSITTTAALRHTADRNRRRKRDEESAQQRNGSKTNRWMIDSLIRDMNCAAAELRIMFSPGRVQLLQVNVSIRCRTGVLTGKHLVRVSGSAAGPWARHISQFTFDFGLKRLTNETCSSHRQKTNNYHLIFDLFRRWSYLIFSLSNQLRSVRGEESGTERELFRFRILTCWKKKLNI